MRKLLLLLVLTVVFVDTMLYAALAPLLPHFVHELGLSKPAAGVLVASYPAGALIGGIPGGVAAARIGPKRAVLVGLASMTLASLGFAFATTFWTLFAARLLQGVGSAFTWAGAFAWLLGAAPRERRGAMIGTAMAAAVVGAVFGPVIGAAAAFAGRTTIFAAVAGVGAGLIMVTLRLEPAPTERPSSAALARAIRQRKFIAGLGLMALPSLLFGLISVLGPLHLAAAGWGAAGVGAVWLVSAGLEAFVSPPLGRLIDRRGSLLPVRVALVAATVLTLGLAADSRPLIYVPLLVLASAAYGALFTPAFALIADGADAAGLAQGMAFGFMNAAWAIGAFVGSAAGGAIAGVVGDWIPFVLAAACCAAALGASRRGSDRERAGVVVDRLAGDTAGAGRG